MGSHASERPAARGDEVDVLELWFDKNPCQRSKRWRNRRNEMGRHSWISAAFCETAFAFNQVLTFADAQPVTVLSLERYLKDATKKTRASYFSANKVSTRASSAREATAPAPSAIPGPSTSQAIASAGYTSRLPTRASSLTQVPKRTGFQYLYDVTISDGVYRERCFLAPELNRLVHTNALRCGLRVKITEASCAFLKKTNSWVMCIEQLEVVGAASRSDAAGDMLPEYIFKSFVPLTGSWKYYLPLWNNEDPCGDIWLGKEPSENAFVDDSAIKKLIDLQRDFGHNIGNKIKIGTHPIIIKITHKGRLQYYGKSTLAVDKPYQASFMVADHSGSMAMVLWNDLCYEWYNSMEVGTVLLIENYGVRRSRPFKTQPSLGAIGMKKMFSIELTLNPELRETYIVTIPEMEIKERWRLPDIKYRFQTRSKLPVTPYIDDCDVVGLVKFVGRTQRMRNTEGGEDFLIYRWVMVADGTSDQTFILQLFSSSQPDIFENIHPMSPFVCTHMKVIREIAENGSSTSYLRTTDESQMFISEWHRGQPYEKEAKVKSVAQWMKTQEKPSHLKETFIGGYYPLPPAPDTFLKYCKTAGVDQVLKTINEIEEEIGKLHYREHKRIAIQGIIGAIKYVDCTKISPDASVGAPEQVSQESAPQPGTSAQAPQSSEQQPTGPRKCQAKRKIRIVESDEDDQDASAAQRSAPVRKKRRRRASKKKYAKRPPGTWENSLWAGIKASLEQHLHYSSVFQESFPSKFDYEKSAFLMQLYNLQASKYKAVPTGEAQTEYACPHEYYQVTIVGMDCDTAIDVALLPVCYSENSDLLQAAGMQYATVELPHTSSQQKTARGLSRVGLKRKSLICILDVCSLGEDKVEVFLNKVYVAEE